MLNNFIGCKQKKTIRFAVQNERAFSHLPPKSQEEKNAATIIPPTFFTKFAQKLLPEKHCSGKTKQVLMTDLAQLALEAGVLVAVVLDEALGLLQTLLQRLRQTLLLAAGGGPRRPKCRPAPPLLLQLADLLEQLQVLAAQLRVLLKSVGHHEERGCCGSVESK